MTKYLEDGPFTVNYTSKEYREGYDKIDWSDGQNELSAAIDELEKLEKDYEKDNVPVPEQLIRFDIVTNPDDVEGDEERLRTWTDFD